MIPENTYTLVNGQTGDLALKLYQVCKDYPFDQIQRNNYYSLIWVREGRGNLHADFSQYSFDGNTLFSFSPYQPFQFEFDDAGECIVINFHPDFFCIHKHQKEVACNGVLFNNIYDPPLLSVDTATRDKFDMVINQLREEMQEPALAQYELLISYLKIFLITASRLKTEQQSERQALQVENEEPFILQNLKNYIDTHYKTKHSASDYAEMLAMTPKALTKLTKTHFSKTLTELISERIIIEAKRELYLTNKTVKEIAYDLGYHDEYYFSRFFKKNAQVSPQIYRDTVGYNRAGVN